MDQIQNQILIAIICCTVLTIALWAMLRFNLFSKHSKTLLLMMFGFSSLSMLAAILHVFAELNDDAKLSDYIFRWEWIILAIFLWGVRSEYKKDKERYITSKENIEPSS